jgi:hypothetical protein
MLDPSSRPVIWNDGPPGAIWQMRPHTGAPSSLSAVITARPADHGARAAGVRPVIVDAACPRHRTARPVCLAAAVVATAPGLVVYRFHLIRTCYSSFISAPGWPPSGNRLPLARKERRIHLIIAVALGIVLAVGGAFAASGALTGVANGSPAKASLYQYGNR